MPTIVKATSNRIAVVSFTTTWDEAKALQHAVPKLRRKLKDAYGIDDLGMRFINPWGGPNHTEFSLAVELAKGATATTVGAVTKWLLDMGRDFLKEYRKKHRGGKPKRTRRSGGKAKRRR